MRRRAPSQGNLRTRAVYRGLSRTNASCVRCSRLVPCVSLNCLYIGLTITHKPYTVVPPTRMIWMGLRPYSVHEIIPSSLSPQTSSANSGMIMGLSVISLFVDCLAPDPLFYCLTLRQWLIHSLSRMTFRAPIYTSSLPPISSINLSRALSRII